MGNPASSPERRAAVLLVEEDLLVVLTLAVLFCEFFRCSKQERKQIKVVKLIPSHAMIKHFNLIMYYNHIRYGTN